MSSGAVITGIGLVTPLGLTADETWNSLLAGQFITTHSKADFESSSNMARVSQLAIRAAREASGHCAAESMQDCALIIGTSKGPVEKWLSSPARLSDLEGLTDFGLSEVASDVAGKLGINGPRLTISTACASGLHALIRGVLLIRSGEARRVLVVASESSVHPLFIESFRRLGIIAPDDFGCRPFDQGRSGFVISEAAASVLLEKPDSLSGGIAIENFAMGADATHLTRMSEDAEAFRQVLAGAISDRPFDSFHAHATATAQHDELELQVMEELAQKQDTAPHLYSHKGALGHSLGAAGMVSVVINVLSHRHGVVPPNIQTHNPLPTRFLHLSRDVQRWPIHRSLAVGAGFGGQIAAVSLVTCPARGAGGR